MLTKDKQSLFSKPSSAFTIIELVIVIVIIGILTAIGIIAYQGLTKRAKETAIKSDLTNARKQLELHKAEYGVYPQTNNCNEPITETNICLQTSPDHTPEYNQEDDGQGYTLAIPLEDGELTIDDRGDIVKLTGWKEIAIGYQHTCGLSYVGKVYCWGWRLHGELGDGSSGHNYNNVPSLVKYSSNIKFKQITSFYRHTCALTTNGQVYCWGLNSSGQLGTGDFGDEKKESVPVLVDTGQTENLKFSQVTNGESHTCALTTNGQVYCWGLNSSGQLGTGDENNNHLPVLIQISTDNRVKQVSAGNSHTCALTTNGQVYCWGYNGSGQMGNNISGGKQLSPVLVGTNQLGGLRFSQITTGLWNVCALTTNGQVYCWGHNQVGELGNGDNQNRKIPTPINTSQLLNSSDIKFKRVVIGQSYGCALDDTDQAYCWGYNSYGQLGDGTNTNQLKPISVNTNHLGVIKFKSITVGHRSTCGVATTGSVYCWGYNSQGELGSGSLPESGHYSPLPAKIMEPWVK